MTEVFDPDWLALREEFDSASRSLALAQRLSGQLPARPRLLDLGAGTGSLFRWLAPIIGRAQVWTFVDTDRDLIAEAFEETAGWAAAQGWTVTFPGHAANRALLVHTPHGAWRVEALVSDLATPDVLRLHAADAVVCSAFLDLVSAAWIDQFCNMLRVPFLACLSVDGRDTFLPRHPADAIVAAGFRRDQARDKGFGPALGPQAPAALLAALRARGFAVASAPSDWHIPRGSLAMLREIVQSHAKAAAMWFPARRGVIADWESTRLSQAMAGRLVIRTGHRDCLAIPAWS
jgi:hypothetical protein